MFGVFLTVKYAGILAPWPGIEPVSPVLKSKVLTPGPPGKSLRNLFFKVQILGQWPLETGVLKAGI